MQRSADIACDITVAIAAPFIPELNLVINKISRPIFITEVTRSISRGVREFPIALNILADQL